MDEDAGGNVRNAGLLVQNAGIPPLSASARLDKR